MSFLQTKQMLQSIIYKDNKLSILNQLKLPLIVEYENINNTEDAWNAIHCMKVRGAPAIAIIAMISVAVELANDRQTTDSNQDKHTLVPFIRQKCAFLCTSRPTAVNIKKESDQLLLFAETLAADIHVDFNSMIDKIIEYANKMLETDVSVNRAIGDFGAQHIQQRDEDSNQFTILTHCNTGSLATAGYGTALGVIRSLYSNGKLAHAYCTETRPYNQGARLTSWELVHDKIPSTLICDDMVAALMNTRKISAVVVGADRVVANGDTANKIGTYQIAILAKYHNIPFYVASPVSTIDMTLTNGSCIPIEERPDNEMKCIAGIQVATPEINCWNPAFDVTPAHLITGGIITELGVFKPDELSKILVNH